MGNFPYQTHFNEIAKEERDLGYPDITFLVRGVNGFPNQIDFRDARKGPDDDQLLSSTCRHGQTHRSLLPAAHPESLLICSHGVFD